MTALRTLTASLLVLSGTVLSLAQGLPSAPHLNVTQRSAFLLLNPSVRSQVKLGANQENAILAVMDAYSKEQMKLLKSRDTLESQLRNNDVQFAKKALAVIQPPQRKELLSIALKSLGVKALKDAEISKKLAITKAQSTKIDGLMTKRNQREEKFDLMVAKGVDYIPKPKPGEDPTRYEGEKRAMVKAYDTERKIMLKEVAALDAKILAILTPAQRSQWKSMTA